MNLRLRRRRAVVGAVLAGVVLLAGACAGQGGQAGQNPRQQQEQAQVKESSPALRALKKRAGVEGCPVPRGHRPVQGGMPSVTLPCLGGGRPVDLARLRGPMVVNLFAQWCGPCRAELPYYQKLHEQARGKVAVLGIDYQDPQPAGALQLAAQTGVTYPLLADPTAQLRVPFRVRGLPGVLLVARDGRVVHEELTEIGSYPQLRRMVQHYLKVAV